MNVYLTLDYELYFGNRTGSVENCMIRPTEAFLKILDPHGIKATFFVDAGYLVALERQMDQHPSLARDHEQVSGQIKKLAGEGHGIELHIHPHWEDSFFDGERWVMDTSRYKLADFSDSDIQEIISRYQAVLSCLAGRAPVAYRAGGWSAQPFAPIGKGLAANDIYIDSSVYPQGYSQTNNQVFDFRQVAPFTGRYSFRADLTQADPEGKFTEIPISSYRIPPFFFWKFAALKLMKQPGHTPFGDGWPAGMGQNKKYLLRLLTRPSYSVVSIDGYKASFLEKAFQAYRKGTNNEGDLVVIGHPKAFTPYSLDVLSSFINGKNKSQFARMTS